jgi:RNA-binding protein
MQGNKKTPNKIPEAPPRGKARGTAAQTQNLHTIKPTVWIGKSGVTEQTYSEIRSQVRARKLVKVKWLRGAEVDPRSVAETTGLTLIQAVGRTMILGSKKR